MPIDLLAYTYAATIAAGGILGYVKSNSIPSLAAGLVYGTVLGYGAYQTSADPSNVAVFLGASTTLGGFMGYRFHKTGKAMPGIITLLSVAMCVRTLTRYFSAQPMKTN